MNYTSLIIVSFYICFLIWKLIIQRREKDFTKKLLKRFGHKRLEFNSKRPPFYPNGWHAVLYSHELHVNQVKNFIALGNNLLALKDKSLKIYVAEAYCSHLTEGLGKMLKHNGDDILKCPIHQCSFRLIDGSIIQNIEEKKSESMKYPLKIKIYQVFETNNMIYIWHNSKERKPNYFPHNVDDGLKQICAMKLYCQTSIQDLSENFCDVSHFKTVHKYLFDYKNILGKFLNKYVYNEFDIEFRKTEEKWEVKLEAGLKLLRGETLKMDVYFISNTLAYVRGSAKIFGSQYEILFHFLPLYNNRIKIVVCIYSLPSFKSRILAYFLPYMILKLHLQDIPILVNKIWITRPIYTKEEKIMKEFREWAEQQY